MNDNESAVAIPVRTEAFALAIRILEAERDEAQDRIRDWPADWFDSYRDGNTAIEQAYRFRTRSYLEACIGVCSRYGVDAAYFGDRLTAGNFANGRQVSEVLDRLITCGSDD